MDKVTANVAIANNLQNVISKDFMTIPEVVMLRNIHGQSAVFNIKITGDFNHDDQVERDRLGNIYGDAKVEEVFGTYGALPQTFEEARIDNGLLDPIFAQDAKKPKKTKKVTKRARNSKGHYIADDPNTEENEAFITTEEEVSDAKG